MIICENEPAELPKDVVRCDTKVDDGIDRLSLNLGNLKEKFERAANEENNSQPSSAGVVIEKPSYNLKKTLMAFETKSVSSHDDDDDETSKRPEKSDRPVVKKLSNLGGFLARQSSGESEPPTPTKPLAVRRSESLMMRLKKYESRIAGDQVVDDDERDEDENNNANRGSKLTGERSKATAGDENSNAVPKKLSSIDLSSLKNQWENGDISKRRFNIDDELNESGDQSTNGGKATSDNSPSAEKDEELIRIRQQLARKKSSGGSSSIKNIYENAIKEAQQQQRAAQANRLNSSDLSALNGLSTTEIQQQLLQNGSRENNRQQTSTPTSSPNKDHFQLNLGNKANKLRERFEQGLINNGSHDDSDENEADGEPPALTKLEQIRQEKLEDLSIFTEGEIKAREARSMFQQIDRRLSNGNSFGSHSRSLSSISASMQAKLQSQMNSSAANKGQVTPGIGDSTSTMVAQNGTKSVDLNASGNSNGSLSSRNSSNNHLKFNEQTTAQRPIRLQNNVRT